MQAVVGCPGAGQAPLQVQYKVGVGWEPGEGVEGSTLDGAQCPTEKLMFVVGATRADEFINLRKLAPDHFFLVPGVGAQGGSLEEISKKAMNKDVGILVNVSRDIIYASSDTDYAIAAGLKSKAYANEMAKYL